MEDRRGADLEEHVPYALLGHVERLSRLEHALVEAHETVDVFREEGQMVDAFEKLHPETLTAGRWDQLAEIVPNRANPAWSSLTTTRAFPSSFAFCRICSNRASLGAP